MTAQTQGLDDMAEENSSKRIDSMLEEDANGGVFGFLGYAAEANRIFAKTAADFIVGRDTTGSSARFEDSVGSGSDVLRPSALDD